MRYHFYKMHGAGNDFLFLDFMHGEAPRLSPSEVRYFCDRHFGAGADGIAVLRPSDRAQAGWDFFNCDGSVAEMCGNAARCAIRFLAERYFPGTDQPITLETRAGIIRGRRLSGQDVEISLLRRPADGFAYHEKTIAADATAEDQVFTTYCVNTGVPHAVIEVTDLATYPINRVGKALVSHPAFAPHGSNITFFQRVSGAQILSTTFERGVEEETFACGTGVAAAAIIFSELYLQAFPVQVKVPGGDLVVEVDSESQSLLLRGPTRHVLEGDLEPMPADFAASRLYGERKNG